MSWQLALLLLGLPLSLLCPEEAQPCCRPSIALTTANTVSSSAAGLKGLTRTMRASRIGTDAEADRAEISSEELKGFRARWKKRGSDAMSPEASDEGSGELGASGLFARVHEPEVHPGEYEASAREGTASLLPVKLVAERVDVTDAASDELLAELPRSSSSSSWSRKHTEQQAVANTDLSVFKYPWEKGRLAKKFTDEPLVKIKVQKLQPGHRNLLQLHVQVDDHGRLSAKPTLGHLTGDASRPAFLDVVKQMEDVAAVVDKDNKRQQALEAWW